MRELHDDLQGQDFIFGKDRLSAITCCSYKPYNFFPYMYLARNTELQNWGLSFQSGCWVALENSRVT